MNIPALSMALSSQNISTDIGVAVLGKSLDSVEQMGDGMQKVLESSVTPYLGQNFDYSI